MKKLNENDDQLMGYFEYYKDGFESRGETLTEDRFIEMFMEIGILDENGQETPLAIKEEYFRLCGPYHPDFEPEEPIRPDDYEEELPF